MRTTEREKGTADVRDMLSLNRAYLGAHRATDALKLSQKVEDLAKDDPKVIYTLGLQFAQAQEYERARSLFQLANTLRPNTAEILYNLGVAFYNLDRLDDASRGVHRGSRHPRRARALRRVPQAHREGQSARALGYWQKVLQLRENYADAYFMIAEELVKNQRGEGAVEYYEKAIAHDPSKLLYYVRLGAIHFRRRRYQQARTIYEQAAVRFPEAPEIHYLVGYAARAEGMYDDAQASFQRALALQPDNVDALANLGFIYTERGDNDKAEQFLRRATAIDPKHFPANYDLGRLLVKSKRYSEALPILEHAATLSKTDPGIHYQLFTVYSRLKRKSVFHDSRCPQELRYQLRDPQPIGRARNLRRAGNNFCRIANGSHFHHDPS